MLQLRNTTPFEASLLLLPDAAGVDTVFTIVKATFVLADPPVIAEEQVPITLADEFHGDPAGSSIRTSTDICLGKPGTDVLLQGSAWAPGGRATRMDVSLVVGAASRTIRAFGDRVWESGASGATISPPQPFERLPLVWERAFGGTDVTADGPSSHARNPVGTGHRAAGGSSRLDGLALPNLEDPSASISSAKDRPSPVCFAPVAAHWEPRASRAGTYDERWQRDRAPYLPDDFDPSFFQQALPEMVVPGYLEGGEVVELQGLSPDQSVRFRLPAFHVRASYRLDGRVVVHTAVLDTVVLEPDIGRLTLTWRAAAPCDKKALRVREVEVATPRSA